MTDYSVKVSVRNGRILRAINNSGYSSMADFCRKTGFAYATLMGLVSMNRRAVDSDGVWTAAAIELCDVLSCMPDDLFTSRQAHGLEKNSVEVEMGEEQVAVLAANVANPEALEASATVERLLTFLNERERMVVMRRMEGYSLRDIADDLSLSGGRVGQIEQKAHRKMRMRMKRADRAAIEGTPQWIVDAEMR